MHQTSIQLLLPAYTCNKHSMQTCLHDSKNRLIALLLPSLHLTFIQTSPTFITMSDSTPATPKAATGIAALSSRETEILGMAWSCLKTGPPDVSSPFLMNAGTLKSMPSCLILLFFSPLSPRCCLPWRGFCCLTFLPQQALSTSCFEPFVVDSTVLLDYDDSPQFYLQIDYNKLAEMLGMVNPRSAANAWGGIKKKST